MQTGDKKISFGWIEVQAYVWLGIPVVIFLFGWMRTWAAVTATAGIALALALTALAERSEAETQSKASLPTDEGRWHDVALTPGYWAALAVLAVLAVVAGCGGFVAQHYDHAWRNAVLCDLTTQHWPVTYTDSPDGQPRMLCYYLTYWLPTALVGDGAGNIRPAYYFLYLWTLWGMAIAYSLLVSRAGGRSRWWMPVVLICFGCLDGTIGRLIYPYRLEVLLGLPPYVMTPAYISFTFMGEIEMIFNQALPCWVALPLIYRLRNRPGLLLVPCALLFPYAPLPCVGISVAVLWRLIRGGRASLSLANIATLPAIAMTGLFFLANNNAAGTAANPMYAPWQIAVCAVIFVATGYAIWLPLIWPQLRHDSTFAIILGTSLLLPFIALGDSPDLGHRATIPVTMMMTYALTLEVNRWKRLVKWRRIAIPVALVLGLIPTIEAGVEIYERHQRYRAGIRDTRPTYVNHRLDKPEKNLYYNNFVAEGDSFYRRYLMRE